MLKSIGINEKPTDKNWAETSQFSSALPLSTVSPPLVLWRAQLLVRLDWATYPSDSPNLKNCNKNESNATKLRWILSYYCIKTDKYFLRKVNDRFTMVAKLIVSKFPDALYQYSRSGGCGRITEIFGSCQRTSQNSENIDRLANSFNSLNDYVMEVSAQSDEKFFLDADELAKVYKF